MHKNIYKFQSQQLLCGKIYIYILFLANKCVSYYIIMISFSILLHFIHLVSHWFLASF